MVAKWTHLFLFASTIDFVATHAPFDGNTGELVAVPFDLRLERLSRLYTEGVSISIPVPFFPSMGMPIIDEGSSAMASSVKECIDNVLLWNTISPSVAWVRKVPTATNQRALTVSIG
jgi:hypothetical protein